MFTWNVFAIISCLTFALSSREKDFCSSSFICVHGGYRSGTHLTTAALSKRLLHMTFSGTAWVASSNFLKIFNRGSSQLSVKSVCLSAQFCLFGGSLQSCNLSKSCCTSNNISFISPSQEWQKDFHVLLTAHLIQSAQTTIVTTKSQKP